MQEAILTFFNQNTTVFTSIFANFMSFIAEAFIPMIIVAYFYYVKDKKIGISLTFSLFISLFFNTIIKIIVKYPRPFEVLTQLKADRLKTATGYSFPSTHTQIMSTFTTSLAMIKHKIWMFVVAFFIIFLVGLSRIMLCVHWPTDVLGGFILGTLIGIFMFIFMQKIQQSIKSKKIFLSSLLLICVITFIILTLLNNREMFKYVKITDTFKIIGLTTAASLGCLLEMTFVNFEVAQTKKQKILVIIYGIISTGIFYAIMKLTFPSKVIFDFIRYFIIGFWLTFCYPVIAVKCNILNKTTQQ